MRGSHPVLFLFNEGVDWLIDLALPETDRGVLAQLVIVVAVWAVAIWRLWDRPEYRLVAFGGGVVALGLMGLRALH